MYTKIIEYVRSFTVDAVCAGRRSMRSGDMRTIEPRGMFYHMSPEEVRVAEELLAELRCRLTPLRYKIFYEFIDHICNVQDPSRREHPYTDSLFHGMNAALFSIKISARVSEELYLAAIGHDWDRACGTRRVLERDYPDSDEGYEAYKQDHALNSADLFALELMIFFPRAMVQQVRHMIVMHEVGGEGDLGILDAADAMSFFVPVNLHHYRFHRVYAHAQGLDDLNRRRQEGLRSKVQFMVRTLSEANKVSLKEYLQGRFHEYDPIVRQELMVIISEDPVLRMTLNVEG